MNSYVDTVFYSWQSDLETNTNRYFIEKALEKAVKAVRQEGLEGDPRIDQDARAGTGTSDIPAQILLSIDKCRVFVGDVSIINKGAAQLASDDLSSLLCQKILPKPEEVISARPTPNPNVLTELGYAVGILGWSRVICVCNEAYSPVEQLPFDIRHRTIVRYNLPPNASDAVRQQQEENLRGQLKGLLAKAIRRTEEEIAAQEAQAAEEEERRQAEQRAKYPVLDLQFFDPFHRQAAGKTANLHCIVARPPQGDPYGRSLSRMIKLPQLSGLGEAAQVNERYEGQMEQFIILRDLYKPLSFIVENSGSVVATDVRVEITIQRSPHINILPWGLRPRKPEFRLSPWSAALARELNDPDIWISEQSDQIHVVAQIGKIQPGRTSSCRSSFYISGAPGDLQLEATVSADNLPVPMKVPLKIAFTVSERTMGYDELVPPAKEDDRQ